MWWQSIVSQKMKTQIQIFCAAVFLISVLHCKTAGSISEISNILVSHGTIQTSNQDVSNDVSLETDNEKSPIKVRVVNFPKEKRHIPEWVFGLIGGIIATLIGFIFSIRWDMYKYKRDTRQKDELIITSIKEELDANSEIQFANNVTINNDINALNEGKIVIPPITQLHDSIWELMRIHLPNKMSSTDMLTKARNAVQLTKQTNEYIQSRENYRINNQGMSNYHAVLMIYDKDLLPLMKLLQQHIEDLQKSL